MNIYRSIFGPPFFDSSSCTAFAPCAISDTFKSYLNQRRQNVSVTAGETSGTSRRKSAKGARANKKKRRKKERTLLWPHLLHIYFNHIRSVACLLFRICPPHRRCARFVVLFSAVWHRCHTSADVFTYATCDNRKHFPFAVASPPPRRPDGSLSTHFSFSSFKRLAREKLPRQRLPKMETSETESDPPSLSNPAKSAKHSESEKNAKGIELKAIFLPFCCTVYVRANFSTIGDHIVRELSLAPSFPRAVPPLSHRREKRSLISEFDFAMATTKSTERNAKLRTKEWQLIRLYFICSS